MSSTLLRKVCIDVCRVEEVKACKTYGTHPPGARTPPVEGVLLRYSSRAAVSKSIMR